jgi:hypothetical protein
MHRSLALTGKVEEQPIGDIINYYWQYNNKSIRKLFHNRKSLFLIK